MTFVCPTPPARVGAAVPLDWPLHPGFGVVALRCDGLIPEVWYEFEAWPTKPIYEDGFWCHWNLTHDLTLADVENAVREDPDHRWELDVEGPYTTIRLRRKAPGEWIIARVSDGFA